MASKDYLQEYLIGLGFDVDQNKLRKFREGAAVAAKGVTELGGAALATVAAIGYMVEKAARQYEDLYYVSQRTGRSVIALKAYEFASRQVGVSAETARGQTEAFHATLRTNPGMQGLLANLGGNAAGGPGDLVATLKKRFGESQYFVAAMFGEKFGIDEQSFRTYWLNTERLAAAQEDSLKRQSEAGVSSQENTKKFLEFANSVDHLSDNLSILKTRFALDFVKPASSVVGAIDGIVEAFNRLDEKTQATKDGTYGGINKKSLFGRVLEKLFGPRGPADGGGAPVSKKGDEIVDYFEKQGWTKAQASGIAANLSRENSGFDPKLLGDGGSAIGIAQWHPDRQAAFKEKFGHDIRESSLKEQLAFVQYELTGGSRQLAGRQLRKASSPEEAGSIVSRYYEGPKDVEGEASKRAQLARQLFGGGATANADGGSAPGVNPGLEAAQRMKVQALQMAQIFGARLGPAPSTVSASAPIINHDTDINIYGNADKAAQQAIVNSQYDIYSQAVRNNLPRTR
jgi:hypothetical protein